MNRRLYVFSFFALFFIGILFNVPIIYSAETGKIAGKVTDAQTGEALPGANVVISAIWVGDEEVVMSQPMGAASNSAGEYFILNIRPGLYSVNCFFMGYTKEKRIKVNIYIDRTTRLDFKMKSEVIEGQEVIVTAYRPNTVEKELTATKQTYTISEVEEVAGVTDIADILELQADVVDNHFRGGRENETNYLIGGHSINNPLSNSRSFEPMVAALKEVEVITSGFSAEYGQAQSGIVNMVMREGGDHWTTRFDFSMDLPHYQMWGGNPYSKKNMPFFDLLTNPEEWLKGYEADGGMVEYPFNRTEFDGLMPDPLTDDEYNNISDPEILALRLYSDSLRIARMAMYNWLLMTRDVGIEYDWMPAHRIDITTGGPISKKMRIFLAATQRKNDPLIPTPHPNLRRQLMGNVTTQFNSNNKLTLSYSYHYRFRNDISGSSMYFDRVNSVGKRVETSMQYALKWNHIFSPSSYMDIAFKILDTDENERPEFIDPGKYRDTDAYNGSRYTENTYADRYRNTVTGHNMNEISTTRGTEKTLTYGFDGSFVSQLNHQNLLKAGIQLQAYDIDVDEERNIKSLAERQVIDFSVTPYEGALYVQDKMEFEGLIANIGLRYDFYNYNFEYYSNIFTPLLNPYYPEKGEVRDPDYALKDKTKFYGRLQPRLGISFPISEKSVFHLNYGTFIQRPGFNQILYTRYNAMGQITEIGNPRLKPEKTSAYDVGIVQALPFGIRLDISAFYKDVQDLVEHAIYVNAGNENYANRANRDYADIKGFNINIDKTTGFLSSYFRYNYQVAKGKASESGDAEITIYEKPLDDGTHIELPDPRDILMDYDRTHRLIANVRLHTSKRAGPAIFNFRPLANLNISTTFTYQTGQPYTWDDKLLGLVNNKRQPSFNDLKLRIQKNITVGNFTYTLYFEGFNLLNDKEWDEDVFDIDGDLLDRWKDGHRDEMKWYNGLYEEDTNVLMDVYQYSRAAQIWRNQPRTFRAGLMIQL